MAQLYYRYSSMNAGKSIELIKIAHNYEEQGKRVLLMNSYLDTRYGKNVVASRIGIKKEAISYDGTTSILDVLNKAREESDEPIHCILIDEGQFLTEKQVMELAQIVDYMNIPVIVYGLKNDFSNHLFEGSQALLIYADKIEEIKTVCWFCDKKATMVLRVIDGKPVYDGEQVMIGGNDSYIPVCRKCYGNPNLESLSEKHSPEE
ncbi:MAG: thymidine kinase [Eubacteriaceae bacterium]|nr:thymidine kinase [Eubacteriaceae bacterium]MBQ1466406.1 thymidine kinase [Eubacteriaceae bacterium]MBR2781379.1 thymidine kinase [Eubacteriaceae bacterium]